MKAFKIYMAGGGTGGHLFPGISLAEAIRNREPDAEIKFLVSGRKLDTNLLEDKGFPSEKVEQRHLPQHPRQVADFMVTNARALWRVTRMMLRENPDVVVGLGGYASFAAATAAKLCRVPLVLLEQNVIPGKANRALAIAADRVFCQWTQASRYFLRKDNLKVAGNPIRESLKKFSSEIARAMLGLDSKRRTLLVLGGSQGAKALNMAMLDSISVLKRMKDSIQVIHLAGKTNAGQVSEAYTKAGITASVHGFLEEMQLAYSSADLVFCRAGGTTIAEITSLGLPCVLVPYPHATQNHQLANAKALVAQGAALLLEEKNITPATVKKHVFDLLLDNQILGRMAEQAVLAGRPCAARDIADNIIVKFKLRKKNGFARLLNE